MAVYVSTGGEYRKTAKETALNYLNSGIMDIELSGGLHSPNSESDIVDLAKQARLLVHNYFPVPEVPFVLNLASDDEKISENSINLVKRALTLSSQIGASVYAVHAGFCIDPKVSELGKSISKGRIQHRSEALNIFTKNISSLSDFAQSVGVKLLIENNVLSPRNHETFGQNPLLMADPTEIKMVLSQIPSSVGFLLDVAHLKVSCRALGLDVIRAHEEIKECITAYHLSDNNGMEDSNDELHIDSWFWPVMRKDVAHYTIEVYRRSVEELLKQKSMVERFIN
jgi:sugar phosphate isomerase/epimerase